MTPHPLHPSSWNKKDDKFPHSSNWKCNYINHNSSLSLPVGPPREGTDKESKKSSVFWQLPLRRKFNIWSFFSLRSVAILKNCLKIKIVPPGQDGLCTISSWRVEDSPSWQRTSRSCKVHYYCRKFPGIFCWHCPPASRHGMSCLQRSRNHSAFTLFRTRATN